MTFSNINLDFSISLINPVNITIKSNKKIKDLFKKINNFKEINLLIYRYIFKNKYSKTIFQIYIYDTNRRKWVYQDRLGTC